MQKYREYKKLDLTQIGKEINEYWKEHNTFEMSVETRKGHKPFVFYEGPPSANGTPGIHHVMARAIKDIFCRYKTMKGYLVERKAGWDTHGLPVELGVEKSLGITKEDIGTKISVEEYNKACRTEVMKYKDLCSDPFTWLYIDYTTLVNLVHFNNLRCERLLSAEGGRYLVRIYS